MRVERGAPTVVMTRVEMPYGTAHESTEHLWGDKRLVALDVDDDVAFGMAGRDLGDPVSTRRMVGARQLDRSAEPCDGVCDLEIRGGYDEIVRSAQAAADS